MRPKQSSRLERRTFLAVLGAGAALAGPLSLSTKARADSESNADKRKPRYRETDHIKTYYRVNRYPTR